MTQEWGRRFFAGDSAHGDVIAERLRAVADPPGMRISPS